MRWLILNPVVVLLVAAAGLAICKLAHVAGHPGSLAVAGGICLLAAELAVGVAVSRRKASMSTFAQACLAAMGIHLLTTLVLCVGIYLSGRLHQPFVWWSIVMFWATLIAVSVALARMLRSIAALAADGRPVPPPAL